MAMVLSLVLFISLESLRGTGAEVILLLNQERKTKLLRTM